MHQETEQTPGGPEGDRRQTLRMEAAELVGEIEGAVDDTRHANEERVRSDAVKVRRLGDLFRQGFVGALLALHLGATAVLSGIVFSESFPYPYMYVSMGILLWLVFAMRFSALRGGRKAAALRSAVVNVFLTAFWVAVLADQIPGRQVIQGTLRPRPDVPLILVAVVMYVLAQVGMIVHGVVGAVSRRRSPPEGT